MGTMSNEITKTQVQEYLIERAKPLKNAYMSQLNEVERLLQGARDCDYDTWGNYSVWAGSLVDEVKQLAKVAHQVQQLVELAQQFKS